MVVAMSPSAISGHGLIFSSRFISTVGSIATTLSTDCPGWLEKFALVSMTYASISGSGVPLPTVAATLITASRGKRSSSTTVQSAQPSFTPMAIRSRNMSAMSAWSSTSSCWMTSSRSGLAGASLIDSAYDTAVTASALEGWDQDPSPRFGDQVVRPHRQVGVADAPEALGVAEIAVGDVVGPLTLVDDVGHLRPRLRDKADLLVADLPPPIVGDLAFAYVRVAASPEEHPHLRLERQQSTDGTLAPARLVLPGQGLLLTLVGQVGIVAHAGLPELQVGQYAHAKIHPRPDGVELLVEGF